MKSADLTSVIVFLSALVLFWLLGPVWISKLFGLLRDTFALSTDENLNNVLICAQNWVLLLGQAVLPLMIVLLLSALSVEFAQVGLRFSFKNLIPKHSRLNPVSGMKRLLGLTDEDSGLISSHLIVELTRKVFSTFLLVVFFSMVTSYLFKSLIGRKLYYISDLLEVLASISLLLGVGCFCIWISVAICDYLIKRQQRNLRLRMSREEMEREIREDQGDPHRQALRKDLHRKLLANALVSGVRKAKLFVIGNEKN